MIDDYGHDDNDDQIGLRPSTTRISVNCTTSLAPFIPIMSPLVTDLFLAHDSISTEYRSCQRVKPASLSFPPLCSSNQSHRNGSAGQRHRSYLNRPLKPTWRPRIPFEVSSTGPSKPRVQPVKSRKWSRAGSASHSRFQRLLSPLSHHVSLAQEEANHPKERITRPHSEA